MSSLTHTWCARSRPSVRSSLPRVRERLLADPCNNSYPRKQRPRDRGTTRCYFTCPGLRGLVTNSHGTRYLACGDVSPPKRREERVTNALAFRQTTKRKYFKSAGEITTFPRKANTPVFTTGQFRNETRRGWAGRCFLWSHNSPMLNVNLSTWVTPYTVVALRHCSRDYDQRGSRIYIETTKT